MGVDTAYVRLAEIVALALCRRERDESSPIVFGPGLYREFSGGCCLWLARGRLLGDGDLAAHSFLEQLDDGGAEEIRLAVRVALSTEGFDSLGLGREDFDILLHHFEGKRGDDGAEHGGPLTHADRDDCVHARTKGRDGTQTAGADEVDAITELVFDLSD